MLIHYQVIYLLCVLLPSPLFLLQCEVQEGMKYQLFCQRIHPGRPWPVRVHHKCT